jgi:polyphenol oxidase
MVHREQPLAFLHLPGDVVVYQFDNLGQYHPALRHFVTTRLGGVSRGRYASLNFSFRTGDDPELVVENRERLFRAIGIELNQVVAGKQVHETNIEQIRLEDRGKGARDFDSALDNTDAMVTNEPGVCLMVLAADCVPVLLYDPVTHAIGAAHAGWRGTVARIAERTVDAMHQIYGTQPSDLIAAIGPSIGPEDYEVGPEVVEQVRETFPDSWSQQVRPLPNDKGLFDLWTSNRLQLESAGVPPSQIEISGISIYQSTDRFYSERREGRPTGRFAAGLMLS